MPSYVNIRWWMLLRTVAAMGCDVVGSMKRRTWLEDENHARAKVAAAPLAVGRRGADDEHRATLEGELPERMVRSAFGGPVGIVVMKVLEHLPEAVDERCVGGDGKVGLEEGDEARPFVVGPTDEGDELLHAGEHLAEAVLRDESVEHFTVCFAGLAEEAGIITGI